MVGGKFPFHRQWMGFNLEWNQKFDFSRYDSDVFCQKTNKRGGNVFFGTED